MANAKLVVLIAGILKARLLSQRALAAMIGLDQAKISRLLRGDTAGFSTDRLLNILSKLGHDVEIRIGPPKGTPGVLAVSGAAHGHVAAPSNKREPHRVTSPGDLR